MPAAWKCSACAGKAEAFARAGLPLPRFPLGLPGAWISFRYPAGEVTHPMAGGRLPHGHITLPGGPVARLPELFHDGRFVLLDCENGDGAGLPACVKTVPYTRCTARLPAAMLVRPDGYVARASGERDPMLRQREAGRAVTRWCTPG